MKKLEFFDTETGEYFKSSQYEIRDVGLRKFAIAQSLDETHECWIVMKNEKPKKNND